MAAGSGRDEKREVSSEEMAEEKRASRVSRRSFLSGMGAAGVVATAQPLLAAVVEAGPPAVGQSDEGEAASATVPIVLRVNGVERRLRVEPRVALLDCLRENLTIPGTKKGCDHGQCGACTVHVNGRRVLSCMSFAVMHQRDEITTIEGLGTPEKMHPMQAAFVEQDAFQCGYCTSGQIMSATALLKEGCGPTDEDVKHGMYGNICRCGAYPNIVAAVQQVRRQA
ncbi:MAG TPA: (2Fe-2S)-binding protein [Acidobacteriaceae bacterium]|jgi:xanthine dehydrogenase YagT iron-sulfur-binding subunit|nr:(2Fe-2S)-binding protein [Acidobacteriaceae bacterium]